MTATALIIDDEPDIRELLALTLSRMGLDYHTAANLEEARQLLNTYSFDVCLTDFRLPDGNGVEFVRYIQSKSPNLPVAVITAHGNMEAAVDAMKNGAYDFVSKPVDIQQLRRLVVQAVALNSGKSGELQGSSTILDASNDDQHSNNGDAAIVDSELNNPLTLRHSDAPNDEASLLALSGRQTENGSDTQSITKKTLVGDSQVMQQLRLLIAKVARTNAPVWITGESGTGKELIARLIHQTSPRSDHAFVAINCGAIPGELMESELFGHVKGSFTGAYADKEGLFQLAQGGTIFLDEVAELPLHMQVKLLRAIQERSVRPVGGKEETPVDARILSASHKDLANEIETGKFRHDLYYRLNVISLHAPALRERQEDISALCEHILKKLGNNESEEAKHTISEAAISVLQDYPFPGNVRELENLLERAIAMVDHNVIEAEDLSIPDTSTPAESARASGMRGAKHSERQRIVDALNHSRWNRKEAAQTLGLTYRQLRYRIQQLGIDKDES